MPGPKPISTEDRLRQLLVKIWRETVRLKSDYAREHADIVAMAASENLITSRIGPGVYAGQWQITGRGLRLINETEDDECAS